MTRAPVPMATELYRNGSRVGVLYWPAGYPGRDPGERIELVITPDDGTSCGFLMTSDDAAAIVRCLTEFVDECAAAATTPPDLTL